MSRYQDVKAAVIAVLNTVTVDSLPPWRGSTPRTISPPAGFVLLKGFTGRQIAGQVRSVPYELIARIAIQWQQNDTAELELDPFVDAIPEALDAQPSLGGVLTSGRATCGDAAAGFWTVNGQVFRVCDFTITVLDKQPYTYTPGS